MKDLKLSLNGKELYVMHLEQFIIRENNFNIELNKTVRNNSFARGGKEKRKR